MCNPRRALQSDETDVCRVAQLIVDGSDCLYASFELSRQLDWNAAADCSNGCF